MIRAELMEEQAVIVLRGLVCVEAVIEAKDASRASGGSTMAATGTTGENVPKTAPESEGGSENADRFDPPCKVRPDVEVYWERRMERITLPGRRYAAIADGDELITSLPYDVRETLEAGEAGVFDGDGRLVTCVSAIDWATVKHPIAVREMRWSIVKQREDGMGVIIDQFGRRDQAVKSQAFMLAKGLTVAVQWERKCYGLEWNRESAPDRVVEFKG